MAADYRPQVCRFEDSLFHSFPAGHRLLRKARALRVIREVFRAYGKATPTLRLVPGFHDPDIGGYADIAHHEILIERGYLYYCLILHEAAHLLAPQDKMHGLSFQRVLIDLYHRAFNIPMQAIAHHLRLHNLPIPVMHSFVANDHATMLSAAGQKAGRRA